MIDHLDSREEVQMMLRFNRIFGPPTETSTGCGRSLS